MGTNKQARAREAARRRELEAKNAGRRARQDRTMRITALVLVIALVLGGGLAVLLISWNSNRDAGDQPAAADASSTGDADAVEMPDATAPDPSVAEGRTWTVGLSTNQGDLTLELDGAAAPQAVASFVTLAESGYFDQTDCHRITTTGIYVLQCGDPTGTGTGGPGYEFGPIENAPDDDVYPAGTLAMARRGGDAESMGSQFFLVYEDSTIPSDNAGGYTVFGRVVEGLDIVDRVATAGTITGGSDGRPALSVIVNEVSVS